jgi:polar amino acid transport system substrate-binding protein
MAIILTPSAKAQSDVVLAVENSWPPFSDAEGNGISKDVIQKAFAAVGMSVDFVVVPYARALTMVRDGSVDGAFNVTKQKSTTDLFVFGDEPILSTSASFYFPIDSKLDFKSIKDIPDHTSVAVIIAYEYGDEYEINKKRFDEVRVSDQKQIIELLRKQRVDFAIMFDQVLNYKLSEMQLPPNVIKKGNKVFTSQIYVAFNQQAANKGIVKKLDEGLRQLKNQQALELLD